MRREVLRLEEEELVSIASSLKLKLKVILRGLLFHFKVSRFRNYVTRNGLLVHATTSQNDEETDGDQPMISELAQYDPLQLPSCGKPSPYGIPLPVEQLRRRSESTQGIRSSAAGPCQ